MQVTTLDPFIHLIFTIKTLSKGPSLDKTWVPHTRDQYCAGRFRARPRGNSPLDQTRPHSLPNEAPNQTRAISLTIHIPSHPHLAQRCLISSSLLFPWSAFTHLSEPVDFACQPCALTVVSGSIFIPRSCIHLRGYTWSVAGLRQLPVSG